VRYIIYGAGAIGGSIGARLFQHGHDVILIARGAHLDALRRDGLTFRTPVETATFPISAVGAPSEIDFTGDDVVLLTMKSQDTAAALDALRDAAGDVPVVCAQNGVANERMAARRFTNVYAMLVVLPATHLEPGVVLMQSSGVGGVLDIGRYPSGVDPLIERVTSDINASGFGARAVADPMRLKYGKLLQNLGNAVQALCEPGDAAGDLLRRVRDEALVCFAAAGIEYAQRDEMLDGRQLTLAPIDGAARSGGSTWQSLARGAGSMETDYLNGEISLLGALHDVPTPANRALQLAAARAVREGAKPGSMRAEDIIGASAA
jgi:2-dehydropantoate 2-reductase